MNDVKLENVELQEEEVNIYTSDCGVTRKACITDCFMTTCLITCAEIGRASCRERVSSPV